AAVLASFWSPDGRWLATLSGDGADGQVAGVAMRHVQGRQAALLNLEFIEVDSLTRIAAGAFRPTPAFLSQYLPFFDQYSRSHSLWAPDSTALVLPTIRPDGTAQLVIFRTDGANRELVRGDMPAWNVR
ncbi:MAG TPA: hypothetical protein VFD39_11190, partial [Trueperaceae bacterium]|nr:hypothetical protein [Trueperaceae bacterium]